MNSEGTIKKAILLLIKDDLIVANLVSNLRELDIDVSNYDLHLPETIFALMGFEQNPSTDEIYDTYFSQVHEFIPCHPAQLKKSIDEKASNLYNVLVEYKAKRIQQNGKS